MGKAEQQAIAKYFPKRPVLYIGGLGEVISISAGVLLSQLLYWSGKGKTADGWIYKTADDLKAELGLSRSNQETAIKELIRLGIISYKLARVPSTRHFKVNMECLHRLLPSLKESSNLSYPNPPNYYVKNEQSITKITRETTTKNTAPTITKDNYLAERNKLLKSKSARPP